MVFILSLHFFSVSTILFLCDSYGHSWKLRQASLLPTILYMLDTDGFMMFLLTVSSQTSIQD